MGPPHLEREVVGVAVVDGGLHVGHADHGDDRAERLFPRDAHLRRHLQTASKDCAELDGIWELDEKLGVEQAACGSCDDLKSRGEAGSCISQQRRPCR